MNDTGSTPDTREPRGADNWMMGCGANECQAEAASDGITMPEGWGFFFAGSDVGWLYACPEHQEEQHGPI